MQGRSLADVIQQPSASVPGVAVTTMFGSVSLRTNIWRYTRYEDGSRELFHIPSDPDNSDNLADQARFASVIGDLDRQLRGELAEVGATYDDVRKIVTQADGADTLYFVNQHSIDLDRVSDAGGIDTVRTSRGVSPSRTGPRTSSRTFRTERLSSATTRATTSLANSAATSSMASPEATRSAA